MNQGGAKLLKCSILLDNYLGHGKITKISDQLFVGKEDSWTISPKRTQAIIHELLSFDALVKIVPIGLATKSQHSKLVILEE